MSSTETDDRPCTCGHPESAHARSERTGEGRYCRACPCTHLRRGLRAECKKIEGQYEAGDGD